MLFAVHDKPSIFYSTDYFTDTPDEYLFYVLVLSFDSYNKEKSLLLSTVPYFFTALGEFELFRPKFSKTYTTFSALDTQRMIKFTKYKLYKADSKKALAKQLMSDYKNN